jgi:ABC-type lipoprotein export system ATPase subunit
MTATQLAGRGLSYRRAGQAILDGVDVQATGGRTLVVCGPSGAGKSSLLAVLGGLIPPTSGVVTLDDSPVAPGAHALRARMAIVLQGYGLVSALTARENVAITLQARGLPREQIRQRAEEALADVGLAEVAGHLIEDVSGGEQQRVAVARALAVQPDVLLADEPSSEVDAESRERIIDLLCATARTGGVVVIASHDPDVVARGDDVLELDAGRLVRGSARLRREESDGQ